MLRPPSDGFALTRWQPRAEIGGFVALLWQVRWDLPPGTEHRQLTLPHPATHIAVEAGSVEVYGPRQTCFEKQLRGRGRVLAARLRPGALRCLLGDPEADLVDRRAPAIDVLGEAWQSLAPLADIEAQDDDACARAFEDALVELLPDEPDPRVAKAEAAVEAIAADPAIASVDELARRLDTPRRTLQRLFTEWVGLSVKTVIRRYRLQEAAARAEVGNDVDWAQLAVELGYYDQSHLIRDFRQTLGQPPERFARRD